MIEAILGYLAVFLLRGGERFVNRKFDNTLDRLGRRAADELAGRGYGQELNELRRDPLDPSARRYLEEGLRDAMGQEPAFAASLAQDAQYLDKRGGQRVIHYVVYGYGDDPFTSRVWWVMALAVVAGVLMFSGFGLVFYALYQNSQQTGPASTALPPSAARGFALFFAGLVVLAVSGIAHQITKR